MSGGYHAHLEACFAELRGVLPVIRVAAPHQHTLPRPAVAVNIDTYVKTI